MQMCSLATRIIVLLFVLTSVVQARDIYVDHERGDDEATGKRPLKTIAKAIRIAEPGDVIHLKATKTLYRESATFSNKSGEPGKPIVLDGHGATLCGSDPLDPAQWEKVGLGLYRSDKVIKAAPAIIMRWYFIFDGRMNLMGRTSKGPKAAFKEPEELKPGEWTYQESDKSFYIKIDPKKKLGDCNVEAPVRSNGVGFGGDCNHIVIRNLTATHVWNDGYNIHGKTRDILFQDVTAIDCGDDGLSAHEDCEVRVDSFVSIGNSTGMCNIGHSSSVSDKAFIKGCHAYDYYMLGSNTHVLTNSIIHAGDWRSVVSAGEKGGVCTVKMDNVVIVNQTGSPRKIEIGRQSVFEAKRVTVHGLDLDLGGISAALTDSVIAGEPPPEIVVKDGTKWSANGNVYGVKDFRIGETIYPPDQFSAYRSATRQDAESKCARVRFETPLNGDIKAPKLRKGTGADVSAPPRCRSRSPDEEAEVTRRSSMKVVIIGGTGHIGTYLTPRMVEAGHDVIVISRGGREPYHAHGAWEVVERVTFDRAAEDETGTFAQEVKEMEPNVVVDLICFTPESCRQLVDALRGRVQHFLHCGTIWVHGPSAAVPTMEDVPRKPFGDYGIRKAAIEAYLQDEARRGDFPATVVHPGHICGPGWAPLNPAGHFNPKVFETLAKGEELALPNLGLETVHHVHADDVAQVFMKAMASWSASVGESFHAVSPTALTLRGYAEAAAAWFGKEANLKFLPWEEWKGTVSEKEAQQTWDHIAHSPHCSIEKAKRLLGYQPRYTSLQATEEAVRWLIGQGQVSV